MTTLNEPDAPALERSSSDCLKELKETVKALQAENTELKRFSDILAHDLRAPLRNMSNLVLLIENDPQSNFSPRTRNFLGKMKFETTTLSDLILELRQISRQDLRPSPPTIVNTNQVLERVLQIHQNALENFDAKVQVTTLPSIQGNSGLIWQLFDNLIRNALKHGQRPLDLWIEGDRDQHKSFFKVTNSIPEGSQPSDDIFAFSSNETNAQNSTGIGLFICKKIVTLHGGQIRARAEQGRFEISFNLEELTDA